MEHVAYFDNFLRKTVNLPDSKLDDLSDRVEKIYKALRIAELGTAVLSKRRQGSWAQRTIINPSAGNEFDADVMVELKEQEDWSPEDYNDAVYNALATDPVYSKMQTPVEPKNRCVRVTYANEMHVDVVPFVDRATEGENIINAETDEWEDTDPEGFTKWMQRQDDTANSNMRRVIRILKYVRDHRDYYPDTKSIILTTVVGNVISGATVRDHPGCYDNVPKTLLRVTQDLAAWAAAHETMPDIYDPSRENETFNHRWSESMYQKFRADIQNVANDVYDAFHHNVSSESVQKWQDLFGSGFKSADSTSTSTKFPATGGGAAAGGTETTTGRSGRAG